MPKLRKNRLLGLALLVAATLVWPVSAQTWVELFPTGGPSGFILTHQPEAAYDSVNNRLIVYYPSNPGLSSHPSPEVWILTNANGLGGAPAWIQLFPTGAAPINNVDIQNIFYDSASNRLVVYGGCYAYCSPALSDAYALTNANGLGGTPAWQPISITNPQPRAGHSVVYDTSNDRMVTFGGNLAFTGSDQNDTRFLSNAKGVTSPSTWTTLTTSGGPPAVRSAHTTVYDQPTNRMTLFGGRPTTGELYNDFWVLSNANGMGGTPTWVAQTPLGGAPPPRGYHSAVYNSTNNTMFVFGGYGSSSTLLGDLWKLTFANGLGGTPTWTQLSPSGTPPGPNASHAAVFDTAHQRMLVLGGLGQDGFHKRVWVLVPGPLYSVCLLYDPTKAAKSGSTIPIKLQLCSSSGSDLSSPNITLHAVSITQISTSISGTVEDSGNANPDNDFRYDSTLGTTGGYIFNLKTTGLATGTYNLNFTVTGDSTVYAAPFQVK